MATTNNSAATAAEAQRARSNGTSPSGELMPLDFILSIMRNDSLPLRDRMEAALVALPYCHAKLASTQKQKPDGTSPEERLKQLAAMDLEDLKKPDLDFTKQSQTLM